MSTRHQSRAAAPSTTVQFRLPDVGEGLTEADILAWTVEPGDRVELNDVIVEIETAKATVELPSPYAGTVTEILARPGETVAVGAPIVAITPDARPGAPEIPAPDGAESGPGAVLVGYGPTQATAARRARRRPSQESLGETSRPGPAARITATPLVRKLATELGVDLAQVRGTGPHGRVSRDDVRSAVSAATQPSHLHQGGAQTRTPIRGVRKHTAAAMVASAFTAPHVTEWVTVDVSRSMNLLRRSRSHRQLDGARLTPLILVIRAALIAIGRHPEINASWDETAGEIVEYQDVNLGIAAATPRGLIVPNLKAAQRLSTPQLALSVAELVDEARAGKTPPQRLRDGTFTITNIGTFGVDGGTPILNPGEAAILCLGQIRRQPWEHKRRIRLREVTTLAMSFDHRLVDGELGSQVLREIADLLEHPDLAFLH